LDYKQDICMTERNTTVDAIEEELKHCYKPEEHREWNQTYAQWLIDLIKALENVNLENLSKIYEFEIHQKSDELTKASYAKSLDILLKNNDGISVSLADKKYVVVKHNDSIKILENTFNAPDNQIIKFED